MRLFLAILALSFAGLGAPVAQDAPMKQYANIKPGLRCHYSRKDWSFCKRRPNCARKLGICDPTMLGHVIWCTEDITVTERTECGDYETYEAIVVTYRQVFENGAWGDKFKRTFRKEPSLIVPPLAKNVIK